MQTARNSASKHKNSIPAVSSQASDWVPAKMKTAPLKPRSLNRHNLYRLESELQVHVLKPNP